jgi:hypothetical protein
VVLEPVGRALHRVPGKGSNADLTFPGGFGNPGWIYVDYGVTQNCAEGFPEGAPGT